LATRLRVHKEQSFHLNGLGSDRVQNALTVYYQEMIQSWPRHCATISRRRRLPKLDQAIPLVVSGARPRLRDSSISFGRRCTLWIPGAVVRS